jgi:hypothetical protein
MFAPLEFGFSYFFKSISANRVHQTKIRNITNVEPCKEKELPFFAGAPVTIYVLFL